LLNIYSLSQISTNSAVQAAVNKALAAHRAAGASQEAEDAAKFAMKDDIDNIIFAWKKGKEDNLRALLSSLDKVLWPELGWEGANLSDLITPQKVKIKYMKAVGRVHPDKVCMSRKFLISLSSFFFIYTFSSFSCKIHE